MAGIGPGDLDVLALEVLEAAVAALDSIPTFAGLSDLQGAPTRQYVSPGRPMPDCEQIAIHAALIQPDLSKQQGGAGTGQSHRFDHRVNLVRFVVTLLRCYPTFDASLRPPKVATLEDFAAQYNADAWAMWNHIWNLLRAGVLLARCKTVYMDEVRALEPSGDFGGWALTMRASLDGYEETIDL